MVRDATSVDRQRFGKYATTQVFPDVAGLAVEDFSQASSGYSNLIQADGRAAR
jgi:hypothetical protein